MNYLFSRKLASISDEFKSQDNDLLIFVTFLHTVHTVYVNQNFILFCIISKPGRLLSSFINLLPSIIHLLFTVEPLISGHHRGKGLVSAN